MFLFCNSTVNKDSCILYIITTRSETTRVSGLWAISYEVEEELLIQPVYFNIYFYVQMIFMSILFIQVSKMVDKYQEKGPRLQARQQDNFTACAL